MGCVCVCVCVCVGGGGGQGGYKVPCLINCLSKLSLNSGKADKQSLYTALYPLRWKYYSSLQNTHTTPHHTTPCTHTRMHTHTCTHAHTNTCMHTHSHRSNLVKEIITCKSNIVMMLLPQDDQTIMQTSQHDREILKKQCTY